MNNPDPPPEFIVWRQDDNGIRAIVGACYGKNDALAVVQTLESRGHKQHYWIEESSEAATPMVPLVGAVPSLNALGRVTAPPVQLELEPPWKQANRIADPTGTLYFECPPTEGDGGLVLVVSGWKLDEPVPLEAYADHYWSNARLGYRKYVPEELARSQFGGRPACGYDWGTGVSEIFAWWIQASPTLLIWAACEVYIPPSGGGALEAGEVSRGILSKLIFLDRHG